MHDKPDGVAGDEPIGVPAVPSRRTAWSILVWAVIGFGAGTGLIAPTILSIEAWDRVIGGMLIGGIPFALFGAAYGWYRSR